VLRLKDLSQRRILEYFLFSGRQKKNKKKKFISTPEFRKNSSGGSISLLLRHCVCHCPHKNGVEPSVMFSGLLLTPTPGIEANQMPARFPVHLDDFGAGFTAEYEGNRPQQLKPFIDRITAFVGYATWSPDQIPGGMKSAQKGARDARSLRRQVAMYGSESARRIKCTRFSGSPKR
jgi:hypothetical protein